MSHTILRVLEFTAGLAMLYIAFFLYEDEERKIGNLLSDLWIRIDERSKASGTLLKHFILETGALTNRSFDRLFGPSLVSPRAICISVCFAMAALSIGLAIGAFLEELGNGLVIASGVVAVLWILTGLVPVLWRPFQSSHPAAYPAVVAFFVTCAIVFIRFEMREDFTLPLVVKIFEVIAASVVLDLIWITANRLIVRRAIARRAITGLIVFQLIVALLIWLSYDPEIWGVELYVVYDLDSVFYWLLASRLLLVAFFAVIFFVQLAAIATRILTPIIGRLMYSAQRFQIIQHRRLTGGIGFGLLGLSLSDPAWLSFVAHLSA